MSDSTAEQGSGSSETSNPGSKFCTNCAAQVGAGAMACMACGFAPNSQSKFCSECGIPTNPGQIVCTGCGAAVRSQSRAGSGRVPAPGEKSRVTAGVLAILLGGFGVHKFYLGRTGAGLVMLLTVVLTFGFGALVMGPIALIEGIIYLTKSDEQFYEEYVVNEKAWF